MTTRTETKASLVAALVLALSAPALAQTDSGDHAEHHPDTQVAPQENDAPPPEGGTAQMPGMMGMMTPEMMQMMMRMMGEGGMSGMMGGMRGGPMAEGMPGAGMMGGGMMGGGGMKGMMGGHALGPGALYGIGSGAPTEMTQVRVEAFLADMLERHGNPRLRIGEITEAEDGSIVADIVTVDGSLVQRLAFNRFPGLFRRID
ncbi:hypothetical protein [Roseovarius autotrophicus]|uniref:hypothetical protein n=1 Tax=Roseovarius autotrophicus TaxID=2824121 RepID=UPI0019DBDF89|nr:hypothetical protein [Roseovarius autotrophicus]MBE0454113.1 hypothetical protein [Roseovarius sp.]